jgi:uncharacterized protein (TIGR03437 family)
MPSSPHRWLLLLGGMSVFLPQFVLAQDVGSGAPNETIRNMFVQAYYRGGFSSLVSLPPVADVRRLGSTGFVQEFPDAAKTSGVRLALVKPNDSTSQAEGSTPVLQIQASLYSYFNSVGVNTSGYPTSDTRTCPPLADGNSCSFQTFDKNYALFVYSRPVNLNATNFSTRDPFYTRWVAAGGIGILGPANLVETTFTTTGGVTGTVQTFVNGAVFNITGGTVAARLITVRPEVYSIYSANGGYPGFLGAPLTEELVVTGGRRRQSFEGGAIDYDPNQTGSGVLRLPVSSIVLAPQQGPIRLNVNETLTVRAITYGPDGSTLTGRDVVWSTSNGRIASITPSGASVLVKAVGGGPATITATSEGRVSAPLSLFVTAPCCAIGEGAPTAALQQAFQDAITRNRLTPRLPAASPAVRVGFGYIQEFLSSAGDETFWIAVSERTTAGYFVHGPILSRYRELGGPAGTLGYPASDPTPGGRQNFENGTLIGTPPILVQGSILVKWASLGYETGIAGTATGDPVAFLSFRATGGRMQTFRNAVIFEILQGPVSQIGRVWAVKGIALAKYAALGYSASSLGAPINDEYMINGQNHQDFEGGFLEYGNGETEARVTENARQPLVTATPLNASAGTVVRLAIGGFENDAQVRVSITGQPDFIVGVPAGAYVWENYIQATSRSSTVTVRAVDTATQASAQATYNVVAAAEARIRLSIVRGDQQTAPPGAMLLQPVVVRLADPTGVAVPNAAIRWAASPGASIVNSDAATNASGEAQAWFRLPLSEGTALGTAEASGQVVTFGARGVKAALTGFPKLTQDSTVALGNGTAAIARKGALLTAAASVVRYYQSRNELPSTQGLADALSLNTYLRSFCAFDASGAQICDGFIDAPGSGDQIVNLWRLGGFVGGGLTIRTEPAEESRIRDLLAAGIPPILAVRIRLGETFVGSHFVAAIGVAANGAIQVHDPVFKLETLTDFAQGALRGELTGVVSLLPQTPESTGFLLAATADLRIETPTGKCGHSFVLTTVTLDSGSAQRTTGEPFSILQCGSAGSSNGLYQAFAIRPDGVFQGTFTDLANPGNREELSGGGSAAFRITRKGAQWGLTPLEASFEPANIVNGANQSPDLAPGSLAAVFGTGFTRPGSAMPEVFVNGSAARVLQAFPFQINFVVPEDASPGPATLAVSSDFGFAEQPFVLKPSAPAIVVTSAANPRAGAVFNASDSRANSRYNPISRGANIQVYATGLARTPAVAAWIGGAEARVISVAPMPSLPGISAVTIAVPAGLAPGLTTELFLIQGDDIRSNSVDVAVQ